MKPTTRRYFLVGLLTLTGIATLLTIGFLFVGGRGREMEGAVMSAAGIGYLTVISFAAFTAFESRWWRIRQARLTVPCTQHHNNPGHFTITNRPLGMLAHSSRLNG